VNDSLAQVVVDEIENAHAYVTATLNRVSMFDRPDVAAQLAVAKAALARALEAAQKPQEPPQKEKLFEEGV
jgi:hypothetical protein